MDQNGDIITSANSEYNVYKPQPGYVEQDPNDWYLACLEVFDKLNNSVKDFKSQLTGISFSGQTHSLVLLDVNQKVIRPAILWNDVRTTEECDFFIVLFRKNYLV